VGSVRLIEQADRALRWTAAAVAGVLSSVAHLTMTVPVIEGWIEQ
jgi:hypothetical protein